MKLDDKNSEFTLSKIENILPPLKQRDLDVVKACWGLDINEPLDIIDAAKKFDLTTDQVNRILRATLKKIRK